MPPPQQKPPRKFLKVLEILVDLQQIRGGVDLKTVDELFLDPDALAAVQTLVQRGYAPRVVAEAIDRAIAHGQRRTRMAARAPEPEVA